MKFMINWNIPEDKWLPVLKKWISMSPQERANTGDGVKMIGRWLDMAGRTGVLIVESNDLAAVHRYVGQWNPARFDLTPVVTRNRPPLLGRSLPITTPDRGS